MFRLVLRQGSETAGHVDIFVSIGEFVDNGIEGVSASEWRRAPIGVGRWIYRPVELSTSWGVRARR